MTTDWDEKSRRTAPDGAVTAFHMQAMTDAAGVAPYGDHVVVVPRYKLLGQYYTAPVFAGYCEEFDYQWIDTQTLEITCTSGGIWKSPENIVKKESVAYGKTIKYLLKDVASHNTRLDPTGDKPGTFPH
jgi:hypothetical protein